ncbi:hypothetical protein Bca4012_065335 [Brassica carinata]|uniref:Uncharacterized protein n=1 Tax=Brassica carinata TaxID=52824 RepID=A0A8X8BDF9_BRACI|nr:hypothetical protein Bca52824_001533 [Brassica carinata]
MPTQSSMADSSPSRGISCLSNSISASPNRTLQWFAAAFSIWSLGASVYCSVFTVDTSDFLSSTVTVSSVLEDGKRRPGVFSYHPSAGEGS